MLVRAQAGGDQLNLLARGWLFAARGDLVPYGNPLSNQGNGPGPLTSLLVGLPLLAWMDHRAPIVLVLLCHVAAYALLHFALRPLLSPRERVLLAVLYWLNPWRVYFSGFLWNPNFLFLAGAAHLATALAMRERKRWWTTFLHTVAIGLAFQLHPSFLILAFASLLLTWRGYLRVHWGGFALALAVSLAALWPWMVAVRADPSILPGGTGFPFRGLLLVLPMVRGLLYWLRHASLSVSGQFLKLDFGELAAPAAAQALRWTGLLLGAIATLSLVAPLLANARLARWAKRRRRRRANSGRVWRALRPAAGGAAALGARAWMRCYLLCTFGGAFIAYALSPTTIMMWQGLIALHAAVLVVVLWAGALARTRRGAPWVRKAIPAWTALSLLLCLAMAFGSRHYHCRGEEVMGVGLTLRPDRPMLNEMLHDLGIQESCPPPIQSDGWKPDVL